MRVFSINRRALTSAVPALVVLACLSTAVGCGEQTPDPDVRAGKWVDRDGRRGVSYQAMYPDGVETYIDFEPLGSADLITVERESIEDGQQFRFVREGLTDQQLPADGPEPEPISPEWERSFDRIAGLVDTSTLPWSPVDHVVVDGPREGEPSPHGGN